MRVAVIDIGSNSIKLLVAERARAGAIAEVRSRTLEVRISAGIGASDPRLGAASMERGAAAVLELAGEARGLGSDTVVAVATSAVRDSSNGEEFRERVRSAAGLAIRILTGAEEAELIGRGLTTDPALSGLSDFDVFDLGGGSLECLSFRGRRAVKAVSLPLGCVRLTERFVPDPSLAFSGVSEREVGRHVGDCLAASGFPLPVPEGFGVVGTGGTLTTARAIEAAALGVALERTDPRIPAAALRALLRRISPLDLAARRKVGGLPAARADVFPAALATLVAIADLGAIAAFQHSFRNLRWGVAEEILEGK